MPLAHDWWKDPIFTATVVLAVFLHLVVLTLQFAMPQENDAAVKEIAVTLRPSNKKIENADFLAQADQQGLCSSSRVIGKALRQVSKSPSGLAWAI